ncbi:hypothetical protein HD554DRAFT_2144482 [Boletus coccyginus]|nr:hypothetical protein HD554DRAFT_2144482 [Boletus coccyginus]
MIAQWAGIRIVVSPLLLITDRAVSESISFLLPNKVQNFRVEVPVLDLRLYLNCNKWVDVPILDLHAWTRTTLWLSDYSRTAWFGWVDYHNRRGTPDGRSKRKCVVGGCVNASARENVQTHRMIDDR